MTTTYNQLVDSIVDELRENGSEFENLTDTVRSALLTRENDFRMVLPPQKVEEEQ